MTLKLGLHHRVLEYYQICSNDDPGFTLTYFTARSNLVPYAFVWEKVNNEFFRNYCCLWFETSNRWPKWQEVSVDIKTLSLGGCMLPALWLYTCIKSWKKLKKSDFKDIFLKLATNESNDKTFLLTSKLCPLGGCLPLPRGQIHVLNDEKKLYKIRPKRFLWNLQQMGKVIRPFCWHQNFVPWGLSAPARALGLYTSIKSWKNLYKIRLQRDFF